MKHRLLFCIISVLMVGADVAATGGVRSGGFGSAGHEVACAEHTRMTAADKTASDGARCITASRSDEAINVYSRYSVECLSEYHSDEYALYVRWRHEAAECGSVHFYNTGENRLRMTTDEGLPH